MLRAQVRALTSSGLEGLAGLTMLVAIPIMAAMSGSLDDEASSTMIRAVELLFVAFFGMYLRGRVVSGGGVVTADQPLPALPVSRFARVASIVLLGEILLVGGTALLVGLNWLLLNQPAVAWELALLFRDDRLPGPVDQQTALFLDLPGILSHALAWAPLLAAGSEGGTQIRGGRAMLYGLGLVGLAAIGVAQSLPLAAIWCVVGLLVLPRIPNGERSEGMEGRPVFGRGLPGVLASHILLTLPLALGMGVIGLGMALMGIAGWQELVGWTTVVTAAMLPVLPASHQSGALQPSGVGTLALLPVSRNRVVAMVFAASFVRIATVAAVAAGITLFTGSPLGDGPLGHPIALLATTMCLTAALQLAGLRHRPLLAIGGMLLGMVALTGGFDPRTDFPAWFTLGMPTLAAIYAVAIAVRTSRRGVWG